MTRYFPGRAGRLIATALSIPCSALAGEVAGAPVSAGSVLQVLLGLGLVLGLVFLAAWAMRRFHPDISPGSSALRIVAGTAVGNRERILLLEIHDTWLVVGVAPGRVSQIHSMPRPADVPTTGASGSPKSFAAWLKHTLDRRTHG